MSQKLDEISTPLVIISGLQKSPLMSL